MVWGEPLNGEAIWIVNLRFTILQWVLVGHKTCLFSVFFFYGGSFIRKARIEHNCYKKHFVFETYLLIPKMVRNVILKLRCFKESAGFKTELQMKGTVKEKRKGVYET